jgi:hypothetical protein
MSILFGILLYALCIAWLCALTGANRLDEPERPPRLDSQPEPSEAASSARSITPRQAHG